MSEDFYKEKLDAKVVVSKMEIDRKSTRLNSSHQL